MADALTQAGKSGIPGAMEMQIQLQNIERQRKLAEMLQQQSFEAPQGQMVSGHYVAASPLQYFAKLAQGVVGSNNQRALDQKQIELGKVQDDKLDELVKQFFLEQNGGGQPQPGIIQQAPAEPPQMPLGSGMSGLGAKDILPGDPSAQAQMQAAQQTPQLTGQGMPRSAGNKMFQDVSPAMLRSILGKPGGMDKLTELRIQSNLKNGEYTEDMKNRRALGINDNEASIAERAKMKKAGMIEYQPGTTTENLADGTTRFQPKVGEGVNIGPDGGASEVPGYGAVNAAIEAAKAGAVTSATEAAKQPFQPPVPVNLPGGPRALTPKQQIDMATGGVPQTGGKVTFQDSVIKGMTPEAMEVIKSIDPESYQALMAKIGQGKQSEPGIPLESAASQAFSGKVASGAGEDLLKTRDKAKSAADDLYGINESRKAIKSGAFLGAGADFKTDTAKAIKSWIGIDVDANKVTNSEYLRATLGNRMLDNAKKLGINPTDADAKRLDAIIGTIAKDPKALSKALDFQEELNLRAIKQHNESVAQAQKNGLQTPYDLTVQIPSFGNAQQPAGKNNGWSIKQIP